MKVLFIGHYRDGTGWANAAIDYILAMDAAGINVVCRPIKLNSNKPILPDRIIELENKSSLNCDVCIQNVLPHHMDYNGHFKKNIALYFLETSSCLHSVWPNRINQMDEAWVCCKDNIEASKKSGINIPIKRIPMPCNITKFHNEYKAIDFEDMRDTFKFYFIGEIHRRKNLVALLKAFHLEFSPNEQVSLLIKADKFGESEQGLTKHIGEMSAQVKRHLKLFRNVEDYKKEVVVTKYLSTEDMYRLHRSLDCFVMPSFGEAWCIPAFEAMAFGNTPICTDTGGMADFLQEGGVLIPGIPEPVFGMIDTFQDIYIGHEDWINIDVRLLQQGMRKVFEAYKKDDNYYHHMRECGVEQAKKYSYETIGKQIKRELDNVI